jgi:hypothetical protein
MKKAKPFPPALVMLYKEKIKPALRVKGDSGSSRKRGAAF